MNQVKKTFFEEDSPYPSFIMERGGTKRPHKLGDRVAWFSNDEINTFEKETILPKIEEENSKIKTKYNFNAWLRKKIGWN